MRKQMAVGLCILGVSCVGIPRPGDTSQDVVDETTQEVDEDPGVAAMRASQRLSLAQLERSIWDISGGLTWKIGRENGFEVMGATLGRPDYVQTLREARQPDTIFQKFLGDAAASVCAQLIVADLGRPVDERRLLVHVPTNATVSATDEAVTKNLQHVLLTFHARQIETGSADLDAWRWLHQSASMASGDPLTAWKVVCVALLSHADFYTY